MEMKGEAVQTDGLPFLCVCPPRRPPALTPTPISPGRPRIPARECSRYHLPTRPLTR